MMTFAHEEPERHIFPSFFVISRAYGAAFSLIFLFGAPAAHHSLLFFAFGSPLALHFLVMAAGGLIFEHAKNSHF